MVLGDGALGTRSGPENSALESGICALRKGTCGSSLTLSLHHGKVQQGGDSPQPGTALSKEPNHAGTLSSDSRTPDREKRSSVVYQPPACGASL